MPLERKNSKEGKDKNLKEDFFFIELLKGNQIFD